MQDFTETNLLFTIAKANRQKSYHLNNKFTVSPGDKCKESREMRFCINVTGVSQAVLLQLALYGGGDHRPGDLAPVLLPDLRQLLLDEPVQHPMLLADVVSHDRLEQKEIE